MKAESLNYNIAGQGLLRTFVYPYTSELYSFLRNFNYDTKFHSTKQLGAMQYLLKGAHHTRYEYIFLQWTLIHQLKEKAKGLGLSSNIEKFGKLSTMGKYPTGGELLQCLSLLVNMGHFPDTFAASKVWLYLLNNNIRGSKKGFKSGLRTKDKELLDEILNNYDVYNIHLINALFLLERYRRVKGGNELVDFFKKIIIEYMTEEKPEIKKYWNIYKSLRKIAYVVLDSHYAPIPFNLDLPSIILNFDHYNNSLINSNSTFQKTLEQMNNVLESSLYLDPNSLLVSNMRSEQILSSLRAIPIEQKLDKVSTLRDLLEPLNEESDYISSIFQKQEVLSFPQPDWNVQNILEISYSDIRPFKSFFPKDLLKFENVLRESIGTHSCRVAAAYPPSENIFKLVFSVKNKLSGSKLMYKVLDIVRRTLEFNYSLERKGFTNPNEEDFKIILFKYLLRNTFGIDKEYFLDYLNNSEVNKIPLFIGNGSVGLSKKIERYINIAEPFLNSDELHELKITNGKIKSLKYRGTIIAYLGSTKLKLLNKSTIDCEFDGLIYLPYQKDKEFLYVVEAKNKTNGHTEAKKQLNKRLTKQLLPHLKFNLTDLNTNGAYASVKINKNSTAF